MRLSSNEQVRSPMALRGLSPPLPMVQSISIPSIFQTQSTHISTQADLKTLSDAHPLAQPYFSPEYDESGLYANANSVTVSDATYLGALGSPKNRSSRLRAIPTSPISPLLSLSPIPVPVSMSTEQILPLPPPPLLQQQQQQQQPALPQYLNRFPSPSAPQYLLTPPRSSVPNMNASHNRPYPYPYPYPYGYQYNQPNVPPTTVPYDQMRIPIVVGSVPHQDKFLRAQGTFAAQPKRNPSIAMSAAQSVEIARENSKREMAGIKEIKKRQDREKREKERQKTYAKSHSDIDSETDSAFEKKKQQTDKNSGPLQLTKSMPNPIFVEIPPSREELNKQKTIHFNLYDSAGTGAEEKAVSVQRLTWTFDPESVTEEKYIEEARRQWKNLQIKRASNKKVKGNGLFVKNSQIKAGAIIAQYGGLLMTKAALDNQQEGGHDPDPAVVATYAVMIPGNKASKSTEDQIDMYLDDDPERWRNFYKKYRTKLKKSNPAKAESLPAKIPTSFARYANDCIGLGCTDNAQFVGINRSLFLKAIKDIQPGEEIFVWYGADYWGGDSESAFNTNTNKPLSPAQARRASMSIPFPMLSPLSMSATSAAQNNNSSSSAAAAASPKNKKKARVKSTIVAKEKAFVNVNTNVNNSTYANDSTYTKADRGNSASKSAMNKLIPLCCNIVSVLKQIKNGTQINNVKGRIQSRYNNLWPSFKTHIQKNPLLFSEMYGIVYNQTQQSVHFDKSKITNKQDCPSEYN
jgi:hypothetical protein